MNKMEVTKCSLCQRTSVSEYFQNKQCKHVYCRNCICHRHVPDVNKLKCFVNYCQNSINVDEMDEYFLNEQMKKIETDTQTKMIHKVIQCNLCQKAQILEYYQNSICKHVYCLNCICQQHVPDQESVKCFVKQCQDDINVDKINEYFLSEQMKKLKQEEQPVIKPKQSNTYKCCICLSYGNEKCYRNSICGHTYCKNCTNNQGIKAVMKCLMKGCQHFINQDELFQFTQEEGHLIQQHKKE